MKLRASVLSASVLAAVLVMGVGANAAETSPVADGTTGQSAGEVGAPPPTGSEKAPAVPPKETKASAQTEEQSPDEMVVTAQRRSERLKDVPAAVTPLTGDELERLGVGDTKDLLQQVAGAELASDGPDTINDISMRGQGSGRNGVSESATGLYENGAYIAGGAYNGRAPTELNLFDLNRAEILHGPQGALYGRNAVGGAINLIVNKPEMDFSAKEKFGYGSHDTYDAMGIVNVPIDADVGMAARLGAFTNNREEGFIRNTTTGDYIDSKHSRGGRFGLSLEPNMSTKVYGQLEYYEINQPGLASVGYVPAGYIPSTTVYGSPIDPDPYTRSKMNREGRTDARDLAGYISVDQTTNIGVASLKLYSRDRSADALGGDFDHLLGLSGGAPGGVAIDLGQDVTERFNLVNAQATLTSNSNGRLKWLVGLEGLWSRDNVVSGFDNCPAYDPSSSAVLNPGCTPGANFILPLPIGDTVERDVARLAMNHDGSSEQLTAVAGFFSASYDILPAVRLGLEGRLARDEKTYDFERYSQDPLAYFETGLTPLDYAAPLSGEYCSPAATANGYCTAGPTTLYVHPNRTWNQFLPGASIRYEVTPSQTVYLRYATGYRPGGFNKPSTDPKVPLVYNPERTSSYEVGWKGGFFGINVDADVYSQTTRDVQVTTYGGGGSLIIIQNPGNDQVYGAELNMSKKIKVGPGRLNLSLGLSSNYGTYYGMTPFVPTPSASTINIDDNRVPRTRNIQGALNATYGMRAFGKLLLLGSSWQFASGGEQNPSNTIGEAGYGRLDLRATMLSSDGWAVSAFGKNVLDRRYPLLFTDQVQFWSQPASYGITVSLFQ